MTTAIVPGVATGITPAPDLLAQLHGDLMARGCFEVEGNAPVAVCLAFGPDTTMRDVMVCIGPARIVGGARDGEVAPRPFRLHVERLRAVFDSVHHCVWDPFQPEPRSPWACVSFTGLYRGTPLCLRVASIAPGNVGSAPMTASFDPA